MLSVSLFSYTNFQKPPFKNPRSATESNIDKIEMIQCKAARFVLMIITDILSAQLFKMGIP